MDRITSLPLELQESILLYLDRLDDILSYCQTCHRAYRIYELMPFWKRLATLNDIPSFLIGDNPGRRYRVLINYTNGLSFSSALNYKLENLFYRAVLNDDKDFIEFLSSLENIKLEREIEKQLKILNYAIINEKIQISIYLCNQIKSLDESLSGKGPGFYRIAHKGLIHAYINANLKSYTVISDLLSELFDIDKCIRRRLESGHKAIKMLHGLPINKHINAVVKKVIAIYMADQYSDYDYISDPYPLLEEILNLANPRFRSGKMGPLDIQIAELLIRYGFNDYATLIIGLVLFFDNDTDNETYQLENFLVKYKRYITREHLEKALTELTDKVYVSYIETLTSEMKSKLTYINCLS